ncbi:hypothetical protein EPR50_G00233870 [Scomber scombrus]|uniref:Uncharacterized protein n=1 Tax=Scomber scombrus TaxID=13677 RepID=A0AAV1NL94_SCOSC
MSVTVKSPGIPRQLMMHTNTCKIQGRVHAQSLVAHLNELESFRNDRDTAQRRLTQSSLRPESEASLETQLRWQTLTTRTRLRWTRQIWRTWRKWKKRRREKTKTAKLVS